MNTKLFTTKLLKFIIIIIKIIILLLYYHCQKISCQNFYVNNTFYPYFIYMTPQFSQIPKKKNSRK